MAAAARRPSLARVVPVAAAVWLVCLAALTWSQLQIWRDTNTLFTYMLELEPDCSWCHAQYGSTLGNRGRLDAALPHLIRAAELRRSRSTTRRTSAWRSCVSAGRRRRCHTSSGGYAEARLTSTR